MHLENKENFACEMAKTLKLQRPSQVVFSLVVKSKSVF